MKKNVKKQAGTTTSLRATEMVTVSPHPPPLVVISLENNGVTSIGSKELVPGRVKCHHNTKWGGLVMFAGNQVYMLSSLTLVWELLSIHRLLSDNARASSSFRASMYLSDPSKWNRKINASFGCQSRSAVNSMPWDTQN